MTKNRDVTVYCMIKKIFYTKKITLYYIIKKNVLPWLPNAHFSHLRIHNIFNDLNLLDFYMSLSSNSCCKSNTVYMAVK